MFYLKLFILCLWLLLCSISGFIYAILFWGRRDINRGFAQWTSWGALRILGIRIEFEGLEHLEVQPAVYAVNHQSILDMVTFGGQYPKNTVVIGKKEVAWVPFFGLFYMAAGNVLIDRKKKEKAVAGLSQAVEAIKKRQVSIWIFPEGTRNKSGEGLLPFKRGPFHMAVQAQVPIVPLVSSPLKNCVSWKERKMQSGTMRIRVLPPISTQGYDATNVEKLCEVTREKMLEAIHGLIS